ncbi:MAG: transcriptional repressor [SAR202 cluster bacterium]|nr:transcriptional repressor [Chloroflexota bacterium]MQF95948.1 transcriptional repressor [SAR202 cluster bacterium]HAA94643.1 transcriptional repressor [Dehalococcoidia bacterium]MBO19840.1 transcriptional repressor [Chloroflexota bacterium]MQG34609.1 transcriptional repressor [SAR202 cluster bacterium]|tara:strand:- start:503 stop:946 length:444 start_codon:yes stop_codon:yes gene_type:complete
MPTRINALTQQLLDSLEEQGYRSTMPRRAVAQAIANQDKHFTAEDLREQLPSLGRATIFRSLKLLVETGVLCRVLLEDGDLHYQLSHQGHHHHLLCVECGASQDLLGCDIEAVLKQTSASHGFELSGHWLEVYGRCRSCADKELAAV